MNQEEFENKWYLKHVKIKSFYQLPDKEYFVTACLLHYYDNSSTIFAIMATDYSVENKHWFRFDLSDEDLDKLDERFEILNVS